MALTRSQAKAAKKPQRRAQRNVVTRLVNVETRSVTKKIQAIDEVNAKIRKLYDAAVEDNRRCGRALGGWDLTQPIEYKAMEMFYKFDPPQADVTTPEGALAERNRKYLQQRSELIDERDELFRVHYGEHVYQDIKALRREGLL